MHLPYGTRGCGVHRDVHTHKVGAGCVACIVYTCADVGEVADGRSRIEGGKCSRRIQGRVGVSPDDFQGVRVVLSSTP